MEFDKDLYSIQEVRNLMKRAVEAQKQFAEFSQEQVDRVVRSIAEACEENAARLAKLAVEETGFGIYEDKILKNLLGSRITYESIKDMKTVGILKKTPELMEIGVPMGVVAALIPSTNPTSTVMYKTLISLKAGNAIVISPHPNAKNCIVETWQVASRAAKAAGAPDGLIGCITTPTVEATNALLKHRDVGIILATGGEAMVRAAYSSGNPALGVGPGNGPSYIEKSADIPKAVSRILDSKTFDNGTICASEQSIVTDRCIADQVESELKRQGGWFMTPEQSDKVSRFILRARTMNPQIVGKSALRIAEMAGIEVPASTRVLLSRQTTVGRQNPYSREKLCPILAFYVEENWEAACKRCIEILFNEGAGHTMTLHTQDESVIREFACARRLAAAREHPRLAGRYGRHDGPGPGSDAGLRRGRRERHLGQHHAHESPEYPPRGLRAQRALGRAARDRTAGRARGLRGKARRPGGKRRHPGADRGDHPRRPRAARPIIHPPSVHNMKN